MNQVLVTQTSYSTIRKCDIKRKSWESSDEEDSSSEEEEMSSSSSEEEEMLKNNHSKCNLDKLVFR